MAEDIFEQARREGSIKEYGVNLDTINAASSVRPTIPGIEAAEPGSKFEMELPWPPSVNPYWRYFVLNGTVRHALSTLGKDYRAETVLAIGRVKPLTGPLSLTVVLFPPNGARLDIDNRMKPLLDAMQVAGVYANDAQIREMNVRFGPLCRPAGKVAVRIVPLAEAQAADIAARAAAVPTLWSEPPA